MNYTMTHHAKYKWDIRFGGLNYLDILKKAEKVGTILEYKINKQCPINSKYNKKQGKFYLINKEYNIVFLMADKNVIITAFPYSNGDRPVREIYNY